MIIILSGKAESGKNKVADIMQSYLEDKTITIAYAHYLKEYAKNILGWDGNENTKPRTFLQEIGDIVKKVYPNLLVERVVEDIFVYSKYFDNIIISDARFKNEIETIKEKFENVVTIRIDGKENHLTLEQQNHNTEVALDDYNKFDYTITNKGTIEELEEQVKKIVGEINGSSN